MRSLTKLTREGKDLVDKGITCAKSGGFTAEQCSVLRDVALESDFGHLHPGS